jgi:hypothetical protein
MPDIRWLHLSDLHVGMNDVGRAWPTAERLLREDLRRLSDKVGPFDIVFFTGDAAQKGSSGEFNKFADVLGTLWGDISAVDTVFIAIPGNHDLARPGARDPIARGLLKDPDARDGLWSGEATALHFVRDRFAAYTEWWDNTPNRPRERYVPGLLPGDFTYTHIKDGVPIGIVGLNSTWLQLFETVVSGDLQIDVRQIISACDDSLDAWCRRHVASVLLTHQPSSWLSPGSISHFDEHIAPPGRFTAHLFGHMHEARVQSMRAGGGALRWTCQAPSLFGLETIASRSTATDARPAVERRHGYVAAQLTLGEPATITLWPRQGVKTQDGAWRIASDSSFHLEEDFARVPPEPVATSCSRLLPIASTLAVTRQEEPHSWVDAASAADLWQWLSATNSDDSSLSKLVLELITACQSTCSRSAFALGMDDPWTDPTFPVRVLRRMGEYLRRVKEALTPERLALLLSAPFVRSAVLASGLTRISQARPLEFAAVAAPDEIRHRLQLEHRANAALVSRTARFAAPYNQIIGLRLAHQAMRKWPGLWRSPAGLLDAELDQAVGALERHLFPEHQADRIMALARCTAGDPALIARGDEALRPINLRGTPIDIGELGALLCVAGHAAMEPGASNAAFVEHLGVDQSAHVSDLLAAVQGVGWRPDRLHHVMHYECASQVLDFTLRQYVSTANEALEQVRSFYSKRECRLAPSLPGRFSPEGIKPAVAAGGSAYRLPHIRFRLDHNRVRTLLMGKSLYGDPLLAIRELYQNALDGCRYRRARQEYAKKQGHYFGDDYAMLARSSSAKVTRVVDRTSSVRTTA